MTARRQTSIKVDAVAWDEAKDIFKEYNLTVTDAINIFLKKYSKIKFTDKLYLKYVVYVTTLLKEKIYH